MYTVTSMIAEHAMAGITAALTVGAVVASRVIGGVALFKGFGDTLMQAAFLTG
jgi:hypothetical protein